MGLKIIFIWFLACCYNTFATGTLFQKNNFIYDLVAFIVQNNQCKKYGNNTIIIQLILHILIISNKQYWAKRNIPKYELGKWLLYK